MELVLRLYFSYHVSPARLILILNLSFQSVPIMPVYVG